MRATDIAHRLATRAEEVCRHLLPAGVTKGRDWCCGSLSGEPGNSLKICLTGTKAGVWADFGGQQGDEGDLIGLWQRVRSVDLETACTEALSFLGLPASNGTEYSQSAPIPTREPSQTWLRIQSALRPGTLAELSDLAELRNLPATAGLELATKAGHLWFAPVWDDGFEWPAWIITDSSRRNAQARRMDGQPWTGIGNKKAKTIQGCEANWPVGIAEANAHSIALVEGGPDFLAAWHFIWAGGHSRSITPVALFGASQSIHPLALPEFQNKQVWIFPHADDAGTTAAQSWRETLTSNGATVTVRALPPGIKDLNELASASGDTIADLFPAPMEIEPVEFEEPAKTNLRPLSSFTLPPDGDRSILLGDRYLNRGDGAILSGTSGMGKSSLALQLAILWALGRPAFGIKPNGPLRSLIIQSEDSDGDIAEMWISMARAMALSSDDLSTLDERIKIVSERVARGLPFFKLLKTAVASHQPDLVFINPLQAFLDGDVTDAQELGNFLRGNLNSLNEPPSFAYFLIHHTTKPATGKDRAERLWHEVMYDMAGGAELINWARAILSLRPAADEGNFNLVLAKRGKRAGATRVIEQGIGTREEIITTIPLKHSVGRIAVAGVSRGLPLIFWEVRPPDVAPCTAAEAKGRPAKHDFNDYRNVFPEHSGQGLELSALHRLLSSNLEIPKKTLHSALQRWADDGLVEIIRPVGKPTRYRGTKTVGFEAKE